MAITEFEDLKGQYIDKLVITGEGEETKVYFYMEDLVYVLYHIPDCCESVELIDICGDTADFDNATICRAECNEQEKETEDGSETYSFYRLDSDKGSIVLRWKGESNGCYSESVDFEAACPTDNTGYGLPEFREYEKVARYSKGREHELPHVKEALHKKQLEYLNGA